MSFADLTPEQRRAAQLKAAETRARNKAARLEAEQAEVAEKPPLLADLGLSAESEDDLRLDDILTNEEIDAIRKKAREQVEAERRKVRARRLMDQATEEARRELDMVPADEARQKELDQLTQIRIDLPAMRLTSGRECPPDPIIIDQRIYAHGHTYRVKQSEYEYIAYLVGQRWQHQNQMDGRSKTYFNSALGMSVSMNGAAPAAGGAAGPSFDAIHRRPA